MPGRPIRRWTLRELLNGADHVCRDLIEHLNSDYAPTVREVAGMLEPGKTPSTEIMDKSVVNNIERVEKSEVYAKELLDRLVEFLQAIQDHADQEVAGASA